MKKLKPFALIAIPEAIISLIICLGMLLKIMHNPLANIILTITLLSSAAYFMTLGAFIFSNVDPRNLKKDSKGNMYVAVKMVYGFFAGFVMSMWSVFCWGLILHKPWAYLKAYLIIYVIFVLLGILAIVAICLSFKYRRFMLVFVRLLLSFILIALPIFGLAYIRFLLLK